MEQKISVVINTYNARKHLERVLNTVKDFDEIVVCDMESTDDTCDIARRYGCKIVTFPKANHKSAEPARTFAIQSAKHDWVLVIDADELVSPQLHDYLYSFIKNPGEVRGLYLPRRNFTMGRFIPSSYPDYQLRFFIREGTVWPPFVHTFPIIQGPLDYIDKKRIELALDHLDDSTKGVIGRLNDYSENELDKRAGEHVTWAKIVFKPMHRFFKYYVLKGGFRYGIPGYVQAYRQAYYKFTVLCKLYEKQTGLR